MVNVAGRETILSYAVTWNYMDRRKKVCLIPQSLLLVQTLLELQKVSRGNASVL